MVIVIRLTYIFAAYNSHEHHAITKTICDLKDTLQRIWTALLQKSIAKGVNDFPKRLETSVSSLLRAF